MGSGISALLLAFYFRQKGRRTDGDKTFEFTHKSFGEYLTSLRILRAAKQISQKLEQAKDDPDSGWDYDEALYKWLAICGPTTMDMYLGDFIRREMTLRLEEASAIQESLADLYRALLVRGWPMNCFSSLRFKQQQNWARNAEVALFACINASARATQLRTKIEWLSPTTFAEALKRMQGARVAFADDLIQSCLSYLDLDQCQLHMVDLMKADLSNSSFRDAQLIFSVGVGAKLNNTDFRSAIIFGCNLIDTEINNANFDQALITDSAFEVNSLPIGGSWLGDLSKINPNRERQIAKRLRDFLKRKNARGNPQFWHDMHLVQTRPPRAGSGAVGRKAQSG